MKIDLQLVAAEVLGITKDDTSFVNIAKTTTSIIVTVNERRVTVD